MQPYEQLLADHMAADERIVVLTAENRAALRNLPEIVGDRFIDFGIAEQTMIGAAAGMASRGRVPIVHALATFLTLRAFEFIRTDVGIPGLPVKIVGGVPGFLSDGNGPTHQAVEDIALMWGMPDMAIFCPADEEELVEGLPWVLETPGPVYVRHIGASGRVAHTAPFAPGVAETLVEGGADVTILTYGFCAAIAVETAGRLAASGLDVRVDHLRTIAPLDEAAILRAGRTSRLVVTLEDHFDFSGLGAIVAPIYLRARMAPALEVIGLPTWFRPGRLDEVLEAANFTPDALAARITRRLSEEEA
jgi:transketolase